MKIDQRLQLGRVRIESATWGACESKLPIFVLRRTTADADLPVSVEIAD